MIEKYEKDMDDISDGEFVPDLPDYMNVKGQKRAISPPPTVG
jgi:hypothetical protein